MRGTRPHAFQDNQRTVAQTAGPAHGAQRAQHGLQHMHGKACARVLLAALARAGGAGRRPQPLLARKAAGPAAGLGGFGAALQGARVAFVRRVGGAGGCLHHHLAQVCTRMLQLLACLCVHKCVCMRARVLELVACLCVLKCVCLRARVLQLLACLCVHKCVCMRARVLELLACLHVHKCVHVSWSSLLACLYICVCVHAC